MRVIEADKLADKDKRGVVVDICDVLEAPTVDAIPVEWIRDHYGWLTMAHEIIKEWEKENEMR